MTIVDANVLSTGQPSETQRSIGRRRLERRPRGTATARPGGASAGQRPNPASLARVLVAVWIDVVDGLRPMAQLVDHVAPALERRLTAQLVTRQGPGTRRPTNGSVAQTPRGASPGERPRVRTVRLQTPTMTTVETVVLVERSGRVSAYAVRLERHDEAWRAVELTAPESGLPALRTRSRPAKTPRPDAFDEVLRAHD